MSSLALLIKYLNQSYFAREREILLFRSLFTARAVPTLSHTCGLENLNGIGFWFCCLKWQESQPD